MVVMMMARNLALRALALTLKGLYQRSVIGSRFGFYRYAA